MIRKIYKLLCFYKRYPFSRKNLKWKGYSYLNCDFELASTSTVFGGEVIFRPNCSIRVRENAELIIGDNVSFNNNCLITCRNRIVIGNNVLFGPNVIIFDHDHDYKDVNWENKFISKPIVIEDDVWIGGNVSILKGSRIGRGAVIGAGCVITGEVPDNTVIYNTQDICQKRINKDVR